MSREYNVMQKDLEIHRDNKARLNHVDNYRVVVNWLLCLLEIATGAEVCFVAKWVVVTLGASDGGCVDMCCSHQSL